jgi:uncharacterized protein YcfJ
LQSLDLEKRGADQPPPRRTVFNSPASPYRADLLAIRQARLTNRTDHQLCAFSLTTENRKDRKMRHLLTAAFAAGLLAAATSANAAGCLSGGVIGGAAGHAVGHGKAGAVAGCLYGHHEHKKQQQQSSNEDKNKQNSQSR